MSWSDTASPEFEDVRRTAALQALAREEFSLGSTIDESSDKFSHYLPTRRHFPTARVGGSTNSPTENVSPNAVLKALDRGKVLVSLAGNESPGELSYRLVAPRQFATEYVGGSVDSSADDPSARLIDRVISATHHDEVIAVLPLLGLRALAGRLSYLHEITSGEDPDEPPMALDSLRELALFFVSEPQCQDPEVGISPDRLLLAEWRVRDGGTLAMKFLPAGLIQFAAISRPTGGQQALSVHGTLPKDAALRAVQAFTHQERR